MIQPFAHQIDFIQALREKFKTCQTVLGVASTGFGKTVVSADIALSAMLKKKRVIFTVHRDNLIWQTSNTFKETGIEHDFIVAGKSYNPAPLVHIASIDTLQRRLDDVLIPDLLVVDEAHLAMADGWKKVVDFYKSKGVKILGNSATPCRLDGRSLGDIFDGMVEAKSMRWLIDNNYLSNYDAYAPPSVDFSKIKIKMGDFARDETETEMSKPSIMGDVVKHWVKLAKDKRTICFCVSINHSKNTVASFQALGIPAEHIDGKTPSAERKRILTDFADGKIKVLCNVELVTTGFDLSAQVGRDVPVEAVILLRPTMSLALYLQMVGRGLRRKPYPAIILDHAGNIQRHGLPDAHRDWSLDQAPPKKRGQKQKQDGPPPPKNCENCFRQCKSTHRFCPHCHTELPLQSRQVDTVTGELEKIDKKALHEQRKKEISKCRTMDELVNFAKNRGYKSPEGWAYNILQVRRSYHYGHRA